MDPEQIINKYIVDARQIAIHCANRFKIKLCDHELFATGEDALMYSVKRYDSNVKGRDGKPATFETFFFNNVHFFLLKRRAKLSRETYRHFSIDEEIIKEMHLKYPVVQPVSLEVHGEWSPKILKAIERLTPRERDVIKLRFMHEITLTQKEVGEILGVGKAAVSNYEIRALHKLKGYLTGRAYHAGRGNPRKQDLKAA